MNRSHLEALIRSLTEGSQTRRTLARGLGAVALAAGLTRVDWDALDAKKRQKRAKRKKRNRKQRVAEPQAGLCVPESAAITCAGVCGTQTNNCGQTVRCSCPEGLSCMANGTCAQICQDGECSDGFVCSTPSVEGPRHCIDARLTCFDVSQTCRSTLECPAGQHCQITPCDLIGRPPVVCVPIFSG